jgi:SAM-dependent methyltransferase
MSLKRRVVARIVGQFHRPRGPVGHLVGWTMAHRSSNRERNIWAVSLLDVQPDDRVLELGFGPGIAIREAARLAVHGQACGVDHSEVMVRQAIRRNSASVRSGHVDLRLGSAQTLPDFGEPFDKILAVNSAGFWPEPVKRLRQLRGLLRAGGRIAIVSQPRCPGATQETSVKAADELVEKLTAAGYARVHVETLNLSPPVVCVLGTVPSDEPQAK